MVLGHDSCGAVKAALTAIDDGEVPVGFVRDLVERVVTSILLGRRDGLTRVDEFEERHVRETAAQLMERSTIIAHRVAAGTLAIAGITYRLAEGRAVLVHHVAAGDELEAGIGDAVAAGACEVGTAESDFGRSGTVVIALSGFSRLSLLGPKPRLISARESGTVLLCHPLSA